MKETYQQPVIEVIDLTAEDVILTSESRKDETPVGSYGDNFNF